MTSAAAPSVMPGALPAVTVPPSGWKAGFSFASASSDRVGARALVGRDHGVALLARHGRPARSRRRSGRPPGQRSRAGASAARARPGPRGVTLVLGRHALGVHPHVDVAGRAPQAVVDGRVDQRAVAEPVARCAPAAAGRAPCSCSPCRRRRSARHRRPGWPTRHHHRLQPRAAHLVDRRRADAIRQPGLQRRLASGAWPAPAWRTWPMIASSILLGGDAGPLDRGANGDGPEVGGRSRREPAAELADRRPGGGEDVHVTHARDGTPSAGRACIAVRYMIGHGTSGDHDGRVQRGGRASTPADPRCAGRWRSPGERPRRAARPGTAAGLEAPAGPPRGRPRGGPRRREAAHVSAQRPVAQADPRLGHDLRAAVERALRASWTSCWTNSRNARRRTMATMTSSGIGSGHPAGRYPDPRHARLRRAEGPRLPGPHRARPHPPMVEREARRGHGLRRRPERRRQAGAT